MPNFHLYNESKKGQLPDIQENDKLRDTKLYIPSNKLMNAVNVAIHLGQPLLVTGEPGTGKTELAKHIAAFFQLGDVHTFHAQTTSQARDLFYRYDALGHFQYAQTQKEPLSPDMVEKKYIRYQGLGEAIKSQQKKVVLMDEIDKAPRDLPNDILAALEDLRFDVPEIGKEYGTEPKNRPIIIMTSNSEKNLPDAFLRRVVYYHIPFPDTEMLTQIVANKVTGYTKADIEALIAHFTKIRAGKEVKMRKYPATAELLNWVTLLHKAGFPATKIGSLSPIEKEILEMSYSVLAKNREDLANLLKLS